MPQRLVYSIFVTAPMLTTRLRIGGERTTAETVQAACAAPARTSGSHNHTGDTDIGDTCIGHTCTGHTCIGHNYIIHNCSLPELQAALAVAAASAVPRGRLNAVPGARQRYRHARAHARTHVRTYACTHAHTDKIAKADVKIHLRGSRYISLAQALNVLLLVAVIGGLHWFLLMPIVQVWAHGRCHVHTLHTLLVPVTGCTHARAHTRTRTHAHAHTYTHMHMQ